MSVHQLTFTDFTSGNRDAAILDRNLRPVVPRASASRNPFARPEGPTQSHCPVQNLHSPHPAPSIPATPREERSYFQAPAPDSNRNRTDIDNGQLLSRGGGSTNSSQHHSSGTRRLEAFPQVPTHRRPTNLSVTDDTNSLHSEPSLPALPPDAGPPAAPTITARQPQPFSSSSRSRQPYQRGHTLEIYHNRNLPPPPPHMANSLQRPLNGFSFNSSTLGHVHARSQEQSISSGPTLSRTAPHHYQRPPANPASYSNAQRQQRQQHSSTARDTIAQQRSSRMRRWIGRVFARNSAASQTVTTHSHYRARDQENLMAGANTNGEQSRRHVPQNLTSGGISDIHADDANDDEGFYYYQTSANDRRSSVAYRPPGYFSFGGMRNADTPAYSQGSSNRTEQGLDLNEYTNLAEIANFSTRLSQTQGRHGSDAEQRGEPAGQNRSIGTGTPRRRRLGIGNLRIWPRAYLSDREREVERELQRHRTMQRRLGRRTSWYDEETGIGITRDGMEYRLMEFIPVAPSQGGAGVRATDRVSDTNPSAGTRRTSHYDTFDTRLSPDAHPTDRDFRSSLQSLANHPSQFLSHFGGFGWFDQAFECKTYGEMRAAWPDIVEREIRAFALRRVRVVCTYEAELAALSRLKRIREIYGQTSETGDVDSGDLCKPHSTHLKSTAAVNTSGSSGHLSRSSSSNSESTNGTSGSLFSAFPTSPRSVSSGAPSLVAQAESAALDYGPDILSPVARRMLQNLHSVTFLDATSLSSAPYRQNLSALFQDSLSRHNFDSSDNDDEDDGYDDENYDSPVADIANNIVVAVFEDVVSLLTPIMPRLRLSLCEKSLLAHLHYRLASGPEIGAFHDLLGGSRPALRIAYSEREATALRRELGQQRRARPEETVDDYVGPEVCDGRAGVSVAETSAKVEAASSQVSTKKEEKKEIWKKGGRYDDSDSDEYDSDFSDDDLDDDDDEFYTAFTMPAITLDMVRDTKLTVGTIVEEDPEEVEVSAKDDEERAATTLTGTTAASMDARFSRAEVREEVAHLLKTVAATRKARALFRVELFLPWDELLPGSKATLQKLNRHISKRVASAGGATAYIQTCILEPAAAASNGSAAGGRENSGGDGDEDDLYIHGLGTVTGRAMNRCAEQLVSEHLARTSRRSPSPFFEYVLPEECAVCIDPYLLEDHVTMLPCRHLFHTKCVRTWATRENENCPSCRYDLIQFQDLE